MLGDKLEAIETPFLFGNQVRVEFYGREDLSLAELKVGDNTSGTREIVNMNSTYHVGDSPAGYIGYLFRRGENKSSIITRFLGSPTIRWNLWRH